MTDIQSQDAREHVIDTMIDLTRLTREQRIIAVGSDILHVHLILHRRGFTRAATTATCRTACGQHDVGLVVGWHSMLGLEGLIIQLGRFLHATAILAVWIDASDRIRSGEIRSLLERWGFRIEAGTRCGDGLVLSARRRERLADAA